MLLPPACAQIFLGMCESDDELTQQAAAGACATLASVPEVAAAMLHEANRSAMLEKVRPTPAHARLLLPRCACCAHCTAPSCSCAKCLCESTASISARLLSLCTAAPQLAATHSAALPSPLRAQPAHDPQLTGLLLSAGSPALQHRAVVWLSSLAQHDSALLFGKGPQDAPPHALTLAAALSLCARGDKGPAPALAKALLRDAERRRGAQLPVPPADVLESLLERCRADEEARAAAAEERAAQEAEAKAAKFKAEREARDAEMKARAAEHRRRQEAEDRQSRKWAGEIDSEDDDDLDD